MVDETALPYTPTCPPRAAGFALPPTDTGSSPPEWTPLRHERPSLRLPDAMIATTALVHGVALTTRNQRDFRPAPGLRLNRG